MISTILKINTFLNSKLMKVIDITGAIGILAYAGYLYKTEAENFQFWAILGTIAITLAVVRPARFFSKKLENTPRK